MFGFLKNKMVERLGITVESGQVTVQLLNSCIITTTRAEREHGETVGPC